MEQIRNWKKKWSRREYWEKYIVLLLFIIGCAVMLNIRSDLFPTGLNLKQIVLGDTALMIVVLGISYVMIVGGIDLSVGYQISLVSAVIAMLSMRELPDWAVILGALAVGMLCGLLNGILVAFLDIVPFAATIATQIIFRGLSYYISKGRMIANISDTVRAVTKREWLGIRGDLWLALLAIALFVGIMRFSFPGTYMRAVGLAEEAAGRAGIKVKKVKCFAYCLAGLLYATAAVILTSVRGYAGSEIGVGMEITGIAAAYIGGVLSQAKKPSIIRLIFGVLMVGTIESLVPKVEILSYLKYLIMGLLLIVVMGIHKKRNQ
ncbi:MAG: ABC transporter permease [Eubacteriales bacterium]|nr:ABC transporter permease [Eubacteriales bacterium]